MSNLIKPLSHRIEKLFLWIQINNDRKIALIVKMAVAVVSQRWVDTSAVRTGKRRSHFLLSQPYLSPCELGQNVQNISQLDFIDLFCWFVHKFHSTLAFFLISLFFHSFAFPLLSSSFFKFFFIFFPLLMCFLFITIAFGVV